MGKHGVYRVWIIGKNNFLLEKASFINGKQHGLHKKWDETRKLISTDRYKDGVKLNLVLVYFYNITNERL